MNIFNTIRSLTLLLLLSIFFTPVSAADRFVTFDNGDILINENKIVTIFFDKSDFPGVSIAATNLMHDITGVCGNETRMAAAADANIVIGTIGHSPAIDQLVKQKKINARELDGKREKFIICTIGNQLVIAGSDRRGTIYGIYELSRQIGVSPWYYWADTPVEHHARIYIKRGVYTDGEPVVRYRGLFLNDEAPCLTSWVKNTFHTGYGGHEFYAKVFELILRLRGNMIWPAMWGWAFYADDSLNSKTADEMGVIVGTSHHEPMARNHQEWALHRKEYGDWNYKTNKDTLDKFFRQGIERINGTEDMVTIGMRGDGDEAMSAEADTRLLQDVVANQRRIISDVTHKPAAKTTQVWALYKEVLDYYDRGMRVPDDVIMLLCDDNWGNVRRVPAAKERSHKGGWGLYYHVDYVGAPRNSKWINVTPTQNMWEQLTLAYDYGIDRMWILNVGDLKPMEYPISLFMDMAWKPDTYTAATITGHTRKFCAQQFGEANADEAARILNLCCKYNGRVTAEMLDRNTYNLQNGEWRQVVSDYVGLETDALRQFITLPQEYRDVYRELILFPVQAMCNLHQMYYAQAMNNNLFSKNNPDANVWADRTEAAFHRDSVLCAAYNNDIAGGKWKGMMTQKHIGYTSWDDNFPADKMPEVHRVGLKDGGNVLAVKDGVVVIEAEHYYSRQDAAGTVWTVIPYMGRTLSGIAPMPYTKPVDGALLNYKFHLSALKDKISSVKVHVIVKSTLDYLNRGGLTYDLSVDGGVAQSVCFNKNLNEKSENIYSTYYPTVARRVVESVVTLPISVTDDGNHILTIAPRDPGIVIEKIVIDCGGYQPSYLFMEESPRRCE